MGTVAVIGLGASGEAAAQLALSKGGEVYVSDLRTDTDARARAERLRERGAVVDLGGHDLARVLEAETVVASPGIPPDAPVLRSLGGAGRSWISEPEYAVRFFQGPLIGITGTNGKTTVAALTAHLLHIAGFRVGLGGNIGGALGPAASELALREPPPDWYVLELSSFQLAGIETLAPAIGVLTNLAPDHLDRYASTEEYYRDKANLFRNATVESRWILNGDDPGTTMLAADAPGRRYRFTLGEPAGPGAGIVGGALTLRLEDEGSAGGTETLVRTDELPLLGRHNVANALAAALAARLAGAGVGDLREGLRSFRPLPHRMEAVGEFDGVLWVNDSKATNVAAARSAVESLSGPLILLLGGKDKGEDFRPLRNALEGRVVLAILYGAARDRLARELVDTVPWTMVEGGLTPAVEVARRAALPGQRVLLSPACSSFDEFTDYQARGEAFRALAGAAPAAEGG